MNPTNSIPLGEEVWVRRDIQNRGGPFLARELFTLLFLQLLNPILLFISILYLEGIFQRSTLPAGVSFFILVSYGLLVGRPVLSSLKYGTKTSSRCPIFYYAEQLNPEILIIHSIRKPKKIIRLAKSTIQNDKSVFGYFTTITLTDQDRTTSATLAVLTPEESDRLIQYWNAANLPTNP